MGKSHLSVGYQVIFIQNFSGFINLRYFELIKYQDIVEIDNCVTDEASDCIGTFHGYFDLVG